MSLLQVIATVIIGVGTLSVGVWLALEARSSRIKQYNTPGTVRANGLVTGPVCILVGLGIIGSGIYNLLPL